MGEFFNTKAFINFDDYDAMMQKLIKLDQDDEKHQEMLNEPILKDNVIPPRIKNTKRDLPFF